MITSFILGNFVGAMIAVFTLALTNAGKDNKK